MRRYGNITASIIAFLRRNNNPIGLLILAFSAAVEYVFPPFPGDAVTLFGTILVVRFGWNLLHVYASLALGAGVGAMIDYAIGRMLAQSYQRGTFIKRPEFREKIDRVIASFHRFGPAFIAANRFFPGLRAFVLIGAGLAKLPAFSVLFFALVSALLWNTLIVYVGRFFAYEWDVLQKLVTGYGTLLWLLVCAILLVVLIHKLIRRRLS